MARIIEEADESSTTPNKIMNRSKRQSLNDSERSATDESWRIVFFIAFIIWIYFSISASVQQQPRDITISAKNRPNLHNSSELVASYYLWGRHWAFDMITCNLAYLQTHYDESGVIVIATNLLFSIGLLIYAIGPTRTDDLFHGQLGYAAVCFTLIFMYCRVSSMTIADRIDWPIPEAIFFMLWYTKRHYMDKENKEYLEEQLPFHHFAKILMFYTSLTFALIVIPSLFTWDVLRAFEWTSALPYVIIAAGFYVALTIHYFMLILTAFVIDQSMDMSGDLGYRLIHPSLFVRVWRYHLSTACYHATLIFPRLKALAVMNEAEFKDMLSDEKFLDRLALTQGKLHDLTLMATAIAGTDHAESLRELLRHWQTADCWYAADLPDLKYFRGYSQIFRSALALLLSTYNLMTLFLWSYGLHDSNTVLATWKYYLVSILIFGIVMRTYDIVMDTILLHSKGLFIEDDSVPDLDWLFDTIENQDERE